ELNEAGIFSGQRPRRRGCEAGFAELFAAGRGDFVRRPRVVLDHVHLRAGHLLLDRALHVLERGTAEEGWRELDVDVSVLDIDRADYSEVDERDDGDLRVGD